MNNKHDESWNNHYHALIQYGQERGGDCNVPQHDECTLADGTVVRLGIWLNRQRRSKAIGKLRKDRLDKLQQLVNEGKLDWVVDRHDDERWNAQYNALLQYGEEHGGDCNVPSREEYPLSDGQAVNLGWWLSQQRRSKATGQLRNDRSEKLQKLVDEGKLDWVVDPYDDDSWGSHYDALIMNGEEHGGNCNIHQYDEYRLADGNVVKLGAWLMTQRHYKKAGELKEDRKEKLQELVDEGKLKWVINAVGEDAWNARCDALEQYGVENGGDYFIPTKEWYHLADGTDVPLGKWFVKQRSLLKRGKLKPEMTRRLNELAERMLRLQRDV